MPTSGNTSRVDRRMFLPGRGRPRATERLPSAVTLDGTVPGARTTAGPQVGRPPEDRDEEMTHSRPTTDGPVAQPLTVESVVTPAVARVALRGESDVATLACLDGALTQLPLNGSRCLELDVTQLRFADAATMRRLALFARQARESGHEITTEGANHTVRKVAGLLGVTDVLGLG